MDLRARQQRTGWLFLAPTLVVFVAVALYPLVQTIIVSLTDARLGALDRGEFVGLENYRKLFEDGAFWRAVVNTVVFTVVSVSLELMLGLVIALIVHSRFRGRGMVRAAMLVPWAIPTVISAGIWKYMLDGIYGVFNDMLHTRFGLIDEKIAFVSEPMLAMLSVIALEVWKTTPFMALLLLAGLQLIPRDIYEAADVDGARPLQKFLRLTLPLLKPAVLVALIFRTLDALRVFDAVWVLTNAEHGTEMMATYNYKQLRTLADLGYGSAVSVVIFLLIGLFVLGYMAVIRVERH